MVQQVERWIASRSLSSGAHSRDPLARNDDYVVRRSQAVEMAGYAAPTRPTNGPTGKSLKTCPALSEKIFRFPRRANQWPLSARLIRMRGGSRSSRTLRWDAVDADAPLTNGVDCGRRSRVVL